MRWCSRAGRRLAAPARRVLAPWIPSRSEMGVGARRRARRWAWAMAASPSPQRPGCLRGWRSVALRRTPGSDNLFLNRRGGPENFLLVLGWWRGLQRASCCRVPGAVPSTEVRGHEVWVFSAFSSEVLPIPVSYRQAVVVQTPKCIGLCCLQAPQAKVLYFRW